jgi:GntR family transcriptional regulator
MIDDVYDRVRRDLDDLNILGIPKHVRLRESLANIVRDGILKPGDQIPPEQILTQAIQLSLGTVRKALNDLAADGVLIREQGRGTFVSQPRAPIGEVWQFRFVDEPGGKLLPVAIELTNRRKLKSKGPWLGKLADVDVCEFRRRIIVNGDFVCASHFYLSYRRFGRLMEIPLAELNLNFKISLFDGFGVSTHSIEQFTEAVCFDNDILKMLPPSSPANGFAIHSLGRTASGEVISYQYFCMPPGPYYLEAPAAHRSTEQSSMK